MVVGSMHLGLGVLLVLEGPLVPMGAKHLELARGPSRLIRDVGALRFAAPTGELPMGTERDSP